MNVESLEREEFARVLDALASSVRLSALEKLRTPRILSELDLYVVEEGRQRRMARQAARKHLRLLVRCGLVRARPIRRAGKWIEYEINAETIERVAQTLSALARRPSARR